MNPRWPLLIFVIFLSLVLGIIGLYFFMNNNNFENEIISNLIAQPFTENNDFMYFHLNNEMKVLFVRPNIQLNETYICNINSSVSRSGF